MVMMVKREVAGPIVRMKEVPIIEGPRLAKDYKTANLVTNPQIDSIAKTPCMSKSLVATGTWFAYKKGKLGSKIVESSGSSCLVFPVPPEHQGKENVALVVNHPDFSLEEDPEQSKLIIRSGKITAIEDFPSRDGYYRTDNEFGIPHGDEFASPILDDVKFLKRTDVMVSAVVRQCSFRGASGVIIMDYAPCFSFDIVLH